MERDIIHENNGTRLAILVPAKGGKKLLLEPLKVSGGINCAPGKIGIVVGPLSKDWLASIGNKAIYIASPEHSIPAIIAVDNLFQKRCGELCFCALEAPHPPPGVIFWILSRFIDEDRHLRTLHVLMQSLKVIGSLEGIPLGRNPGGLLQGVVDEGALELLIQARIRLEDPSPLIELIGYFVEIEFRVLVDNVLESANKMGRPFLLTRSPLPAMFLPSLSARSFHLVQLFGNTVQPVVIVPFS
mmetsp:Transcript_13794/g.39628  ORF Transcript_13794/g.39628 Transcript_13794/m.39628 type:complete len:243 (-) Transcript_13794:282-1010(-)